MCRVLGSGRLGSHHAIGNRVLKDRDFSGLSSQATASHLIGLAIVAGVALGAAAVQGLHAQAKPKAWSVSELETLDAAARTAFVPVVQAAQKAAGGRIFNTGGGRIVASEGAAAPKSVAITE